MRNPLQSLLVLGLALAGCSLNFPWELSQGTDGGSGGGAHDAGTGGGTMAGGGQGGGGVGGADGGLADGGTHLRNPETGVCLGVVNGLANAGAAVAGGACDATAPQRWARSTTLELRHLESGLCLDSSGPVNAAGFGTLQLADCDGGAAQQFIQNENSAGTLLNKAAGACVTVAPRGSPDGTVASLYYCAGTGREFFVLEDDRLSGGASALELESSLQVGADDPGNITSGFVYATAAGARVVALASYVGSEPRGTVSSISSARDPTWIFEDDLAAGWSTAATSAAYSLTNTSPVAAGQRSIRIDLAGGATFQLTPPAPITDLSPSFVLMVNGGPTWASGDLQVFALADGGRTPGVSIESYCAVGISAGAWTSCGVPLAAIAPSGSSVTGLYLAAGTDAGLPTLYVDQLGLSPEFTSAWSRVTGVGTASDATEVWTLPATDAGTLVVVHTVGPGSATLLRSLALYSFGHAAGLGAIASQDTSALGAAEVPVQPQAVGSTLIFGAVRLSAEPWTWLTAPSSIATCFFSDASAQAAVGSGFLPNASQDLVTLGTATPSLQDLKRSIVVEVLAADAGL